MSFKDHSLLEIMGQADEDRADGDELVEARKILPKGVERGLPLCMLSDSGDWDIDVIVRLTWIMAKRDDPNISQKDIQKRINMGNIRPIVKNVAYFFSDFSEQEVDALFDKPAALKRLSEANALTKERLDEGIDNFMNEIDGLADSPEPIPIVDEESANVPLEPAGSQESSR